VAFGDVTRLLLLTGARRKRKAVAPIAEIWADEVKMSLQPANALRLHPFLLAIIR
jgi:hypothetical protein